jgi:hypothetical protein
MSRVHSRHIAAPLDRAILDSAASPVRVLFGILFLAWSWVSTVLILGGLLAPAIPSALFEAIPNSYLVAFGFALLITAVEFVAAGRWPLAYTLVLLILDAPFTAWQTYGWLTAIIEPIDPHTTITIGGSITIGLVAIICGIVAAIFGELLLFGRRR